MNGPDFGLVYHVLGFGLEAQVPGLDRQVLDLGLEGQVVGLGLVLHCVSLTPATGCMYTVNHKKGGSTLLIITLENLDRFL